MMDAAVEVGSVLLLLGRRRVLGSLEIVSIFCRKVARRRGPFSLMSNDAL